MLVGTCLTRKFDWDDWLLRRIARTVLDHSAALLGEFRKVGKEPMICSEFVFRTRDEALSGLEEDLDSLIESYLAELKT